MVFKLLTFLWLFCRCWIDGGINYVEFIYMLPNVLSLAVSSFHLFFTGPERMNNHFILDGLRSFGKVMFWQVFVCPQGGVGYPWCRVLSRGQGISGPMPLRGGGVGYPVGAVYLTGRISKGIPYPLPREWKLLRRSVHILLECFLVILCNYAFRHCII